jgi:hypothetical protein
MKKLKPVSQLYAVTVTTTIVVSAPTDEEALEIAYRVHRDVDTLEFQRTAVKVQTQADLPTGWTHDCLPWDRPGAKELTIGQILASIEGS